MEWICAACADGYLSSYRSPRSLLEDGYASSYRSPRSLLEDGYASSYRSPRSLLEDRHVWARYAPSDHSPRLRSGRRGNDPSDGYGPLKTHENRFARGTANDLPQGVGRPSYDEGGGADPARRCAKTCRCKLSADHARRPRIEAGLSPAISARKIDRFTSALGVTLTE